MQSKRKIHAAAEDEDLPSDDDDSGSYVVITHHVSPGLFLTRRDPWSKIDAIFMLLFYYFILFYCFFEQGVILKKKKKKMKIKETIDEKRVRLAREVAVIFYFYLLFLWQYIE